MRKRHSDAMKDVKPVKAGWYNAFRPWTLHGAIIPVVIGGMVAQNDGHFNWIIFIMVLICGCLLQSAANILNTYGDYVKGTDTVENEGRSPELVSGKLRPKHMLIVGMACLGIVALCGLVFICYIGWGILLFGILGIAGAGLYTIGVSYKYHGLGLISVFCLMGMLMPAGTYYVLSGTLTAEVILLSIPNAFILTAVLSGNETRDYHEDRKANVGTLSQHLSYKGSMRLYLALNAIAFPILLALIITGYAPLYCAIAFITLYEFWMLLQNSKNAETDRMSNIRLVPLSFKLNWHFGVLLAIGYLLEYNIIPVLT